LFSRADGFDIVLPRVPATVRNTNSGLLHLVGWHGHNTLRVVVARQPDPAFGRSGRKLDRATQYAATLVIATLSPLTTDPGYWIARLNRAMTLKM
jgi:hypothetical protein